MNKIKQKENVQKISSGDKSEEVQSIIERMPTEWCKWMVICVTILASIILLLGFWIKYPDTVDGQITLSASKSPIRLVAKNNGKIILLSNNNDVVSPKTDIAYIYTGTRYQDVYFIDSIISNSNILDIKMPDSLLLGELSTEYNSFVIALHQYQRFCKSDIYKTMYNTIKEKIEINELIIKNLDHEYVLKKKKFTEVNNMYKKDSVLFFSKAIADNEYKQSQLNKLSIQEDIVRMLNNKMLKQSEINQSKMEMQRLLLEETENGEKLISEYMTRKNNLNSSIQIWKDRNLLISPISGQLEYLGFWKDNHFVQSGQELFSIIPEQSGIYGEVLIPSLGAGKVKVGQFANIKMHNYPYDEFGLIKGKVQSISRMNNVIKQKEQMVDTYLVRIEFPDGLRTNFNINLPLDFESKGSIEIITKSKRLIERLFDNLKSRGDK